MLTAVLLLASSVQTPALEKNAGAIITKLFQRYYSASSARGTILSESKDDAGAIGFKTTLAYERPAKILVTQDRKGRNGLNYRLVSDGTNFSYDPPRASLVRPKPYERLFEPVMVVRPGVGRWSHKIGDIYAVGHSSLEFCVSLDIIVAHDPHLLDFKTLAATYKLEGMEDFKGKKVYKITGKWRSSANMDPSGDYMLLVSQEFDLLMFTLREKYQVSGKTVNYSLTEVCDVQTGLSVPPDLFKVN